MKIWLYGDSFTAGDGLLLPSQDILFENFSNNKFWGDYIKDYYGAEELINKGVGGNCNEVIYLQFLNDLEKFESGDLVIVGNTFTTRRVLPHLEVREKDLNKEDWTPENSNNFKFNIFRRLLPLGSGNTPITWLDHLTEPNRFQKETGRDLSDVYNSMLSYISNVVKPTDHVFQSVEKLKVELVFKLLNRDGIRTFFWDVSDTAEKFETYTKATKGKVEDDHWSWKGSENFGKFLTKKI